VQKARSGSQRAFLPRADVEWRRVRLQWQTGIGTPFRYFLVSISKWFNDRVIYRILCPTVLILPAKAREYVFTGVVLCVCLCVCVSVCLSVCDHDN